MKKNPVDIETMTYEQAYAELEQVVAALEGDQSALEESLTLFERGQALARRCAQLLDQAELRVRQLRMELGTLEADEEG